MSEDAVVRAGGSALPALSGRKTGRMALLFGVACVALTVVVVPLPAEQLTTADSLFREALLLERGDGDVAAAAERYERVAADPTAAPVIRARALLQLGHAYGRLGRPNALSPYERIVRDYKDQTAIAAEAASRLASARAAAQAGSGAVVTARTLWDGPGADRFGSVSRDGRYLSYMDPDTGDLAIYDLVTRESRRVTSHVTNSGPFEEFAEYSVFSPDGSRLAYSFSHRDGTYDLRVIGRDGGEWKRVLADRNWLMPYAWSPDGRDVLAIMSRGDRTRQLVFVSADTGDVRPLRTLESDMGVPTHAGFSPDGRFVAYSRGDVFIIPADGRQEEVAVIDGPSDERFLGWFPDGSAVLVSSDRGGRFDAYVVKVRDGRPSGGPTRVQENITVHTSYGFTQQGDFVYFREADRPDTYVASIEPRTGTVIEPPRPLGGRLQAGRSLPAWSPDGERLAVRGGRVPGRPISIYHLESGTVVNVPVPLSYLAPHSWTADGRAIVLQGSDSDGRAGIFKVDPATGAVESLGIDDTGLVGRVQVSPDGKWIYYRRFGPDTVVLARDLATRQTREIYRPRDRAIAGFALSPDGEWLALLTSTAGPSSTVSVEVMPARGGNVRTILEDKRSEVIWHHNALSWAGDSRYVFAVRSDALWRIPLTGDPPERLALNVPRMRSVAVSPDGRRIAIDVLGDGAPAIRALGNLTAAAQ